MSEQHARLGPSNHRWPHCPGSPREEERYPDIPGAAAIDGTGSHLLLELCLKDPNKSIWHYDQTVIGHNHPDSPNGWLVDPERIKRVEMAIAYINRRIEELKNSFFDCDVLVLAEAKSDPGGAFGITDWWGTCDVTLVARHKMTGEVYFVEVIDYKDGREFVPVKWNTQLISYLFGRLRDYIASGNEKVRPFRAEQVGGCRMTIVQPKTNPVIRYQCSTVPEDAFSVQAVIEKAESLSIAARNCNKDDAPLIPGKHCRWCKANPKRGGHCTAQADQSLGVVTAMSTELTTTGSLFEQISGAIADPKSLTEEQLSQLADAEAGIQAVFDKVKEEIKDRIEQGIEVPGYAMEPGRGSNIWNEDEEVIAKKLKACRLKNEDIYPSKLISPAQMMKLDKLKDKQKERLQKELVTFVAGKKSLKKVSRDVAQSATNVPQSAEMMFGDVANTSASKEEVSFF